MNKILMEQIVYFLIFNFDQNYNSKIVISFRLSEMMNHHME